MRITFRCVIIRLIRSSRVKRCSIPSSWANEGFKNLRTKRSPTTTSCISNTVPKAPWPTFDRYLYRPSITSPGLSVAMSSRCKMPSACAEASSRRSAASSIVREVGANVCAVSSKRALLPGWRSSSICIARAAALETVCSVVSSPTERRRARTVSSELESAKIPSACSVSMRISLSDICNSGSREGTIPAPPIFVSARMTDGIVCVWPVNMASSRGRAFWSPIAASASTARSLTHQSVSAVAPIKCSTARSS